MMFGETQNLKSYAFLKKSSRTSAIYLELPVMAEMMCLCNHVLLEERVIEGFCGCTMTFWVHN